MIVAPQLSSGWQHNYSNKTRQAGWANEQSIYYLMSMGSIDTVFLIILQLFLRQNNEHKNFGVRPQNL